MKQFKRQLRYDLRAGTFQYWIWYVVIFVFFLCIHSIYLLSIKKIAVWQGNEQQSVLSYFDYVWNVLKGVPEFAGTQRGQSFSVPMEWFVLQIICMIWNLFYPYMDFYERNIQFFLQAKSRKQWWYSKCTWVVINTILYYSVFFISGIVATIYFGTKNELTLQRGLLCSEVWIEMPLWKQLILLFLLPVVVSIAVGIFVVLLSIFFHPIGSVSIGLGIYIASVYWEQPYLIGNYSMLVRSSWLQSGKMNAVIGMVFSVGVIACMSLLGSRWIQKKDVHKKGRV